MTNKQFREFIRSRDQLVLNVLGWNVKIFRALKRDCFQTKSDDDKTWQEIFKQLIETNVMMCQSLVLESYQEPNQDVPQEALYGIPKEDYQQVEFLESLLTSDEGDDTIREHDNGKD